MKIRGLGIWLGACAWVVMLLSQGANAQPASSTAGLQSTDRNGQHDFDFHLGKWNSRISRLVKPLTGSSTWVSCHGTLMVRKVWNGRAQIEELEADCPDHHIEDLLLFLYNPSSHQWSLNSAAIGDGVIAQPMFGEFRNGRGEFFDQERAKGRMVLVRQVWSNITPTSHQFEQSFSADGGRTWEANFNATLTRAR